MEYTRYYTMFYVEPTNDSEDSIVRDVLKNECVDFTAGEDGCIHILFAHGSERIDHRIVSVARALYEHDIDMHGRLTRVEIGDHCYSVKYGFVENGQLFCEDLDAISNHINSIDTFKDIEAFADRKDRKHLCLPCPECGRHTEVYADFGPTPAYAPLIVLDDGDIYIDYEDMDIDFEGVFRCGYCDCEFTHRTDELKELIPTQDKQESENDTGHAQSMVMNEPFGSAQYVYKHPIEEINLTV